MKPILFVAAALIVGVVIGNVLTRYEFADEEAAVRVEVPPPAGEAAASSSQARSGPRVTVVNGERHHFGSMDRNEHRSHAFQIRNDGDAPLRLVKGHSTCKCTVGELTKDTLAPGETVEVKLEWDAKSEEHRFEQSVDFTTNDPARRTIHLSIVGEIIDAVRLQYPDMHFNDVSRNEPSVSTQLIHAFRSDTLTIENVELTNREQADYFDISFEPASAEELAYVRNATAGLKLRVELKPGLPVGRIEQTIRLTTNVRPENPLEVNVVGNVASDILLAGPRVVADRKLVLLPPFKRLDGIQHTVYVVVKGPYRNETEMRVASVQPPVEFAAELGEPQRDNPRVVRVPLTIEIPPNATPVSRMAEGSEAEIKIATTHPDDPEVTVRVRYLVKTD